MARDKSEIGRLELGLSGNSRNHWHEWFGRASKRKRAKGSAKGDKGKDNGVVEAFVEQVGLDGQLLVSRVQVNDDTHLLRTVSNKRKGS